MTKHTKRVVLGEGHPWFFASRSDGLYDCVQLTKDPVECSLLLRSKKGLVPLKLRELGNWNRIRLVAEVLE